MNFGDILKDVGVDSVKKESGKLSFSELLVAKTGVEEREDKDGILNEISDVESKTKCKEDEEVVKRDIIGLLEEVNGYKFSEEQIKVIKDSNRPLNVVACAGAGKSSVLISKILYMEEEEKISPTNVIAISFNRESVTSLRDRYKSIRLALGKSTLVEPTFSTFHSLFFRLLRGVPKYRNIKVVDEKAYTFNLLQKVRGNSEDANRSVLEGYMSLRGRLINEGYIKEYQMLVNGSNDKFGISFLKGVDLPNFSLVMGTYETLKEERKEIDFEDMQVMLREELIEKGNTKIAENFQSVYDKFLIDEYQDINSLQIEIMDVLIGDKIGGLITVGDADQSIYGFRGSDPKYITNFTLLYKGSVRHFLGNNFRCKSNILESVVPSIEKNETRVAYEMKAENSGGEVYAIEGDIEPFIEAIEYDFGKKDEDTAVLVRLNMQQKILSDLLTENDIDVCINRETSTIRRDLVYRDVIGLITAIKNEDADMLSTYSGKIFPYIKKEVWKDVVEYDKDWEQEILYNAEYKIPEKTVLNINKVKSLTKAKSLIVFAYKLLHSYYERISEKGYVSMREVELIVRHMHKTAYDFGLADYLKRERLKEQKLQDNFNNGKGIKIYTMHGVKGLEFDNVYIYELDDRILPDMSKVKAIEKQGFYTEAQEYLEEERRLFYVAWTRAKNKLVYYYTSENNLSMFGREIDDSKIIKL